MSQSHRHSLAETGLGTALGFGLNMAAAAWAFPLVGVALPLAANFKLTLFMTGINMALRYGLRRLFNRWHR